MDAVILTSYAKFNGNKPNMFGNECADGKG
jgi:hypothetical protein